MHDCHVLSILKLSKAIIWCHSGTSDKRTKWSKIWDPKVAWSNLSVGEIKKKKILAALAELGTGLTTDTTNKKKKKMGITRSSTSLLDGRLTNASNNYLLFVSLYRFFPALISHSGENHLILFVGAFVLGHFSYLDFNINKMTNTDGWQRKEWLHWLWSHTFAQLSIFTFSLLFEWLIIRFLNIWITYNFMTVSILGLITIITVESLASKSNDHEYFCFNFRVNVEQLTSR